MAEVSFKSLGRRQLLEGVGAIFATGLAEGGFSAFNGQENPKKTAPRNQKQARSLRKNHRRLLYNYDAWSPFYNGKSIERIHENIDLLSGTQVTTVMLSPNAGQSLTYPSKVGEMSVSRPLNADEKALMYKVMGEEAGKALEGIAELWRDQGIDPFGLVVERAVAKGLETFVTFRMNDVHLVDMQDGQGPYTDTFYRQHPEYRIPGSWGLNYAVPQVRAHRLATLEELVRRYPIDGLELDYLRSVPFSPMDKSLGPSGQSTPISKPGPPSFPKYLAEESAPIMTDFVGEVRRMVERVSKEKGHKILLTVRVPSSLSGCRRLGLDPIAWHRNGYLDFLTVGYFLHLFFNLPIADFKSALPGLTIYGCLDYVLGGPRVDGYLYARDATAEVYRGAAAALFSAGADGIYLFNMFACRANGPDPKGKNWNHYEPFEVLREIGDPLTLEDKEKLYLVDSRFHWLDMQFYDVKAQLPQEVTPDSPLTVTMRIAEKNRLGKRMTLRVEVAKLTRETLLRVQLNGHGQGTGKRGTQSHLFKEEYDQMPPDPTNCVDFPVRSTDLKLGENEVVVLSSSPIMVKNIELAVYGS